MFKIEKLIHKLAASHYDRRAQIDAARAQRAKNLSSITSEADEKEAYSKKHLKLRSRAKTAAINKDYHEALSSDGYDISYDDEVSKEEEKNDQERVAESERVAEIIEPVICNEHVIPTRKVIKLRVSTRKGTSLVYNEPKPDEIPTLKEDVDIRNIIVSDQTKLSDDDL